MGNPNRRRLVKRFTGVDTTGVWLDTTNFRTHLATLIASGDLNAGGLTLQTQSREVAGKTDPHASHPVYGAYGGNQLSALNAGGAWVIAGEYDRIRISTTATFATDNVFVFELIEGPRLD